MNTFGYNGGAFNGGSLDASVRSAIDGQVYAIGGIVSRVGFRTAIDSLPEAVATLVVTVFRPLREVVAAVAEATAALTVRVAMRGAFEGAAQVQTVHAGYVATRLVVSSPLVSSPEAVGVIVARIAARSPVAGTADATSTIAVRAALRAPLSGTAEAAGYVDGDVARYVPFDENAIPENTFVVQKQDTVFYVR